MTLCVAIVSTFESFHRAFLSTNVVWLLTNSLMAGFDAKVTTAFEGLFARHSTAERLLIAGNCVERIVFAVAEFFREKHARWAIRFYEQKSIKIEDMKNN